MANRFTWEPEHIVVEDDDEEAKLKSAGSMLLDALKRTYSRDRRGRFASAQGAFSLIASGMPADLPPGELGEFMDIAKDSESANLANLNVTGEGNENLFDSHLTDLPRSAMPQLGTTKPESMAKFEAMANSRGIATRHESVDPRKLVATQGELDSRKVAEMHDYMVTHNGTIPGSGKMVVSAEGGVVDGHHRWAAAAAYAVNNPGTTMDVVRVNAGIEEVLALGHDFAQSQGIAPRTFGEKADDDDYILTDADEWWFTEWADLIRQGKTVAQADAEMARRYGDWPWEPTDAVKEMLAAIKHLTGQHDQKRHGHGKANGMNLPGGLTQFDTEDVIAARAELAGMTPTDFDDGGPPARPELAAQIITDLESKNGVMNPKDGDAFTVARERRADIFMGPPAAGKSSIADPIRQQNRSMLIDSDEVKAGLPEFNGGRYAGLVQEESSKIANTMLERAVARGDNVTIPVVGKSPGSIRAKIDYLEQNGYSVNTNLVVAKPLPGLTSIETSAQRAVTRFEETGRFVDPAYVLSVDAKPQAVYSDLQKDGMTGSGQLYTTG